MDSGGTVGEALVKSNKIVNGESEVESTRPASACGSQDHPPGSVAPSLTSISVEERLRRARAAEELRQKHRYEAYLESQRQAEIARLKAQEDRKRKIEEIHQRAEARRQLVLERRKELELSTKARLESLLERSRAREVEQASSKRRHTDNPNILSRTASASPSVGSSRHPNQLMTTSCVVAFGSSAPRSTFSTNRSNSSNECNKLGRPPGSLTSLPNGHPPRKTAPVKPIPHSTTNSCSSSVVGSSRSNSSDVLSRRAATQSFPSVFERLTSHGSGRSRPQTEVSKEPSGKVPMKQQTQKTAGITIMNKRRLAPTSKLPAKGMSVSVYSDRTDQKHAPAGTKRVILERKRSASPTSITVRSTEQNKPVYQSDVPVAAHSDDPGVVVSTEANDMPSVPSTEVLVDVTPDSPVPSVKPDDLHCSLASAVHSGPLKAETQGAGEGGLLSATEQAIYRAKLIEQRRLAKERMEEEQRRLTEEQSQRRSQEEAERLATEQAEREQAELAARQAAEAQRQREEEEKARLREVEAERLAKLQQAEQERIIRKQRLANIMSRVKPTSNTAAVVNGKMTNDLPSSPPASASSPLLFERCEPVLDSRGDASDSFLHGHHSEFLAQSSDPRTGSAVPESPLDTRRTNTPVSFTLCAEPHKLDSVDTESHSEQLSSSTDNVSAASMSNPNQCNGNAEICEIFPGPAQPGSPASSVSSGRNASPTTVSPTKTSPVSATSENAVAPKFKSALLQSMLGGGRLTTRAKDAVQDIRSLPRRTESASELSDLSPVGDHCSPSSATFSQPSTQPSNDVVMQTNFDGSSRSTTTQSNNYRPQDSTQLNSSKETDRPTDDRFYTWPGIDDLDNNNADPVSSSVALSTSTG